MILVSFLGGRSRLERELDLTVNQGKAEGVTVLKKHDILAVKRGGEEVRISGNGIRSMDYKSYGVNRFGGLER